MRNVRRIVAVVTGMAGTALAAMPAAAQDSPAGVRPSRFTIQGYLAQYSLDTGVGDREAQGGFGVRLMFNRSDAAEVTRSFFGRATAGVYGTFTTEDAVSSQNVGVQADVSLFPAPIANGFLDPFISLGAGAFRTSVDVAGDDVSETSFTIIPAAGTRIPLFGGIGIRGDLRAPIVFGDDTRVNWLAEGGLSISF